MGSVDISNNSGALLKYVFEHQGWCKKKQWEITEITSCDMGDLEKLDIESGGNYDGILDSMLMLTHNLHTSYQLRNNDLCHFPVFIEPLVPTFVDQICASR